jgi:hypothetical protein
VPVASRAVPRRALVLLVLGLVAGATVAGVQPAHAAQLSRAAARPAVERSVHEAYPTLAFGNVACPHDVRRARGVSFTCTVQLPGTFLVVDAKQTDGTGTIRLSTQQAVIPTQSLRDLVAQNASLPATVDCGVAPFRVARAGQVITCSAALADGTTRTVQLTVQNTAGNVTLTSVS